jgi:hypothetical protein
MIGLSYACVTPDGNAVKDLCEVKRGSNIYAEGVKQHSLGWRNSRQRIPPPQETRSKGIRTLKAFHNVRLCNAFSVETELT